MKSLKFLFIIAAALSVVIRSGGQTPSVNDEIARARELAGQGKTAEASAVLTGLMGTNPANRDLVQNWLIINMKRTPTGEEEAIGQLDELQKSYPGNLAIIFFKAFIQTEYRHYDDALANAEILTSQQPDTCLNWLMKGQILEFMNRNDEAMGCYNKATSLDPKNADAWQNEAGLFAKMGMLDESISSYSRAIDLAPGVAGFIYNRGCSYCRKGDQANALADLGKAVALQPQLKQYAQKDEDYKTLWESNEFKKLVSE